MMLMMMALNKDQFGGQARGDLLHLPSRHPIPRASFDYPTTPDDQDEEAKVALPSVDQILAKYVQTLGGEQAIRKDHQPRDHRDAVPSNGHPAAWCPCQRRSSAIRKHPI